MGARDSHHVSPRSLSCLGYQTPSGAPPPLEPTPRRGRINTSGPGLRLQVSTSIQKHVAHRIPHLGRRPQHHMVKAVQQDTPLPPEHPVHGPRQASSQRIHPSTERTSIIGLDDQVQMVGLDRVVHEPKVLALEHAGKRPLHLPHQSPSAKRRDIGSDLQGHMAGKPRSQRRSPKMGNPRIGTTRASGAFSPAAPTVEGEFELRRATHHSVDSGIFIDPSQEKSTHTATCAQSGQGPARPSPDGRP